MANDDNEGTARDYPTSWRVETGYDPNQHLLQLKGKDYLPTAERLRWFVNDQRALIRAGLATTTYVVKATLVELDEERGYAHFSCYVRDVLGNEATMYGSETRKDFPDFAEKASTKAMGRTLLALGYGTAFAPEMDEGDRVVDTPKERRGSAPQYQQLPQSPIQRQGAPTPIRAAQTAPAPAHRASDDLAAQKAPAAQQHDLCARIKETFGYKTYADMDKWLNERVASRGPESPRGVIGAENLWNGKADLDMAEQSLILGILDAQRKVSGGGRH